MRPEFQDFLPVMPIMLMVSLSRVLEIETVMYFHKVQQSSSSGAKGKSQHTKLPRHMHSHTRAHTLTQAPKHIGMCALFLYPTVALLWMAWVYLSQALPPDDKNWQMLKPELTVPSCHLISWSVMDQTDWAANLFLLDQATSRSANKRRSTQTLLTYETLRRKNYRLEIFETRERLGSRPGRLFSFRNSITSRALLGFSQ